MGTTVYLKGKPLTLCGRELETGEHAPDFTAVGESLETARLSDFRGKIKLVTFFPSLDTSVCSDQVKEFNRRALQAGNVAVIGISMDLPFSQARFRKANSIGNMALFSDHRRASFGSLYGVLIEELRLLARGAFIIDSADILRFSYLADELSHPVDFENIAAALDEVVRSPAAPVPAFPWRCIPCEKPSTPLDPDRLDQLLARGRDWTRYDGGIRKEFDFRDFDAAMRFAEMVRAVADEEGYAPGLEVNGSRLTVRLATRGGLSENEFIMSGIIDQIRF